MKNQAPIWLFDGVCVLCSGAVRYVLKHEHESNMRFIAIQSAEGKELGLRHGINPDNPDSFLFIESNMALKKSDGVLALLRHIGGPARFLRIGAVLPKTLRDWLYDRIAQNRYSIFGRSMFCMVPDQSTAHRFVMPEQKP